MRNLAQRLSMGAAILEALDQKRIETGDPAWGQDTEYAIIVAELWDLEEEILLDPGALEAELIRDPGDSL
jgi:hypothetical protein